MEHYIWDEMQKEVLSPTIARKMIWGDKAMVAQVFSRQRRHRAGALSRE